jgi:inhibitor of cysteine peptidase
MKKAVLYSVILMLLFSCSSVKLAEKTPQNRDFRVALNSTFEVDLEANPSTGYIWQWANESVAEGLKMVNSDFKSTAQTNIVGASGTQTFIFKGVKLGIVSIELIYICPWEKAAPPAKRVLYQVEVY